MIVDARWVIRTLKNIIATTPEDRNGLHPVSAESVLEAIEGDIMLYDRVDRKTAKWETVGLRPFYTCSSCKSVEPRTSSYCPNCGARMYEGDKCRCYTSDGRCLGTREIDPVDCHANRMFCIYSERTESAS